MKTNPFLLSAAILLFSACSKNNSNPSPGTSGAYINTAAGSTWNYHEDNSSGATPASSDYTLTSTSRDSTINGKKYHAYDYSNGGSQYLNITGHDYYQFDSIPVSGGVNVERLYLKDDASAGATWKQDFDLTIPNIPLPITLTVTNTIAEKGISRTVNGISYTNVTHVSTKLSATLIPANNFSSSIDSYYAPKYGLIENTSIVELDYLGLTENVNVKTQLVSADLK